MEYNTNGIAKGPKKEPIKTQNGRLAPFLLAIEKQTPALIIIITGKKYINILASSRLRLAHNAEVQRRRNGMGICAI